MNLNQMEFIKNCTNEFNDCNICIVISHSCDIARPIELEPNIEVLPCHITDKHDGNFIEGRNCRKLLFQLIIDKKETYYYIIASEKICICKDCLNDYQIIKYDSCGLKISFFQNWLASRYRRQTLPDNLNKKIGLLKLKNELKNVKEELLSIFIEEEKISDSETAYTLILVSDYSLNEATEKIDLLECKLNNKLENIPDDSVNLSIQHISNIDLSYDILINYSKYDCDYLCAENDLPTIDI